MTPERLEQIKDYCAADPMLADVVASLEQAWAERDEAVDELMACRVGYQAWVKTAQANRERAERAEAALVEAEERATATGRLADLWAERYYAATIEEFPGENGARS